MPHRAIAKAATEHPFLVSLVVLLAIVLPGFWRTQQAIDQAQSAALQAKHNAVVACQNDNRRAEAGALLWTFILGTPPQKPPRTPAEAQFRRDLGTWINGLYQKHDCSNLDKQYKLPNPPTLTELRRLRHTNTHSAR